MFIEIDELLGCSFCLGPVHSGPIKHINEYDGSIHYHQLLEDGSAQQNVELYKQVNFKEVHPDNISLIVKIRDKLKSNYDPYKQFCQESESD